MSKASPGRRRYRCKGGRLAVIIEDESQWKALAKCLGRPELAYPGAWRAASVSPPRGRLGRLLERVFAIDTVEVWLERLESHGVPCRKVG